MRDVEECCTFESAAECSDLRICGDECCKPVVSNADRGDKFSDTAEFKAGLAEDSELLDDVSTSTVGIWYWEYLCIVQEYDLNSMDFTFMNAKCVLAIQSDRNILFVLDTSRILCKIASLSLAIALVVRGYHPDLLSKKRKPVSQLVHHDTKATDCRPATKLRSAKYDRTELVALHNGESSFDWS